MDKIKIILTCFVMVLLGMTSCSTDDNVHPKNQFNDGDSSSAKISAVYEMFGLKRDAFMNFGLGENINLSDKSVSMADVRKADSKLFVCVLDSMLNMVVLKDSVLSLQTRVTENYYDEQKTFLISRVHPNYYRTKQGGIVVVDLGYAAEQHAYTYRSVAYFLDMVGDSVIRRDTSMMPQGEYLTLREWENDNVMMTFRNHNTGGYIYAVYTLDGDKKLEFENNYNLFDENINVYCLSTGDFVMYSVDSHQIYASHFVVNSNRVEQKWVRYMSLPAELSNARVKAYPKVADGKITFEVVAMLRNGETRKLYYLFDLETGNNF